MILIISNKNDLTTDFVVQKLNTLNISFYRLNTEDLFSSVNINFDFDNNIFEIIDIKLKKTIDLLNDVKSVYCRRPIIPTIEQFEIKKQERNFIEKEIYYILEGLYSVLKNKFWINNPNNVRYAENKILQLQIAKELGFKIPKTILSNIKQNNETFLIHNPTIIKPVKSGLVSENKKFIDLIYTQKISLQEIQENNSSFPLYLQEEIKNKTDIRITVVGNKIFAVDIIYNESNIIDWRHIDKAKIINRTTTLPPIISKLCFQLLKALNLNFGAIDMAVDNNGNYYFLEINPNGQWAWLENILGLKISDEIVKLLMEG